MTSKSQYEERMMVEIPVVLLVVGIVLPWLIVALGCWVGYQLIRQNGRILLRLDALEEGLIGLMGGTTSEQQGLPVGSEAPAFQLPDLNGNRVSLEDFRGKRVLLIFFSPDCAYCEEMSPDLAKLPFDGSDGYAVPVVVTTEDPEENKEFVEKYGLRCPFLLDEKNEVSEAYRASGTPTGYLIDEEGHIASERTEGGKELLALAKPPTPNANDQNDKDDGGGGASGKDAPSDGGTPKREVRIPIRGIPKEGIGVGDVIKRFTDALGIKPCKGCERRRQVLNRWVIRGSGRRVSAKERGV